MLYRDIVTLNLLHFQSFFIKNHLFANFIVAFNKLVHFIVEERKYLYYILALSDCIFIVLTCDPLQESSNPYKLFNKFTQQ